MRTAIRRVALLAGLLGAGTLLAYGPGIGGLGFSGHHGPGGHIMSMDYGPAAFLDGDVDARLERIKTDLGITPEQQSAWNDYATSLKAQADSALAAHQARWSNRGAETLEQDDPRRQLWQQRQQVHEAAGRLIDVLDEAQRLEAGKLLSYGMHHAF